MGNKGNGIWDELEGVKESLTDEVEIKFGDVEVELEVRFIEAGDILEINQEYDEKKPAKPEIKLPGYGKIKIPNKDYKKFDDHEKAQEWYEKCKPIERERKIRLAYEFLTDEFKPDEDYKKGIKILDERLREIDIANIVNAGLRLSGFLNKEREQEKDS